MIASVAAFAVVGALTGGAVATAATQSQAQTAGAIEAKTDGILLAKQQDATLVGAGFAATGNGRMTIRLGERPVGATGFVAAFRCAGNGDYSEQIDGKVEGGGSCGSSSEIDPITTNGDHTLTLVTGSASQQLTIWASWISVPKIEPSAAQLAEVADGVVTRAEYLAAFNRYAGCLAAAGYPLGNVDESATVLDLSIPGAAVDSGVDNRCYASEWQQVDTLWQLQNWSTSASVVMMRQCLADQGITPAATEDAMWNQVLANPTAKKCMDIG
ncbi:MAG: hypothetical protein WDM88_05160 [Galbitalea sp.]